MQRIPRRQYTDDFKALAVSLAESIGRAKAARQLDVSVKTLANWLTAARAGKPRSASTLCATTTTATRPPGKRVSTSIFRARSERTGGVRS